MHRSIDLIEESVGPCQFCGFPGAVDIYEYRTKTFWFGFFGTKEQVDRMAMCRHCQKSIKEVYYTLRETKKEDEDDFIPMIHGQFADV